MQGEPSPELVAKNREVQRLFGRCLLRIQQIERVLKAVVVVQHHYGSGADSLHHAQQRAVHVSKLGMGDLVDFLLAEVVHIKTGQVGPDGQEVEKPSKKAGGGPEAKAAALAKRHDKAQAKAHSERRPWFSTKVTLSASPEEVQSIATRLTALVQLRNRVVHHFSDDHTIRTEAGCDSAIAFLEGADTTLAEHTEHLGAWALAFDETMKQMARELNDPAVLDQLFGPADNSDGAESAARGT